MTTYKGVDYGMGKTNIGEKGIRFGVINQNEVGQAWFEQAEADYGPPTCPKCGNEAIILETISRESDPPGSWVSFETVIPKHMENWKEENRGCIEYACEHCEYLFSSDDAFGDEPLAFSYTGSIYKIHQSGNDTDLFIEKSPFFTYAQFCSPCAPGAVYLMNPLDEPDQNNKGYCLGHDWFESGKAPYKVFNVETGEEVSI